MSTILGFVRPKGGHAQAPIAVVETPAKVEPAGPVFLATLRNEKDSTEVYVTEGSKGFHVSMRDLDSGLMLPSVKICPKIEAAMETANQWAGVKEPTPSAELPVVRHTITEKTLTLPDGQLNRMAGEQSGLIIRLKEGKTKPHDGMHPLPVLEENLKGVRDEQARRMDRAADDLGLPRPGFDWHTLSGGLKPGTVSEKEGTHFVLDTERRWSPMSEGQMMAYADPKRRAASGYVPLNPESAAPAGSMTPSSKVSEDHNDPNSPGYRFKDTGEYVPGSRKELAADMIRRICRTGQQVKVAEIDWDSLESNPREAKDLITKSNLFGTVDWAKLREEGMEPGAGFLIDRIYSAIGKEPSVDSPQARHDYTVGLESIRQKLESCKTADQVAEVLDNLGEEYQGITLNPSEKEQLGKILAQEEVIWDRTHAFIDRDNELSKVQTVANCALSEVLREQSKRANRGWKPSPELDSKIPGLQQTKDEATAVLESYRDANPDFKRSYVAIGGRERYCSPIDLERTALRLEREGLMVQVKARNLEENPFHRGLNTMGERFLNVLQFRSARGSDAFANHMAVAKAGKIPEWDWLEKETTAGVPRATQESVRFQLKIADTFERVGGRDVKVESTDDVKRLFGLRGIQSGNWVLNDFNSAKFHVEHSARAFADMADILGIRDEKIGLQGELAMAYGARGTGNAGWNGAAAAQYSPTYRVINLTKERGGSCLAHEYWHSLDNLIAELETGKPASKLDYVTENPDLLPEGKLKEAMKGLADAMWEGDRRLIKIFSYTPKHYELAQLNLTGYNARAGARNIILTAGSLEKALDGLSRHFPVKDKDQLELASKFERSQNRKMASNLKAFSEIAIAWYGGKPEGGEIKVPVGRPMSSFAYEAHVLDAGKKTPYWSTTMEMAARAFQAFTEDSLNAQGRRNDYLAAFGDNKFYVDPVIGPQRPYPEGSERTRINAAFDRIVEALRESALVR